MKTLPLLLLLAVCAAVPLHLSGGEYDPQDPRWIQWRENSKKDPKFEWKTQISFYGRVIDQHGKPVDGALVTLSWTDLSPQGTSVKQLRTDKDGLFILQGVRGKHLLVRSIDKDGFIFSATNRDGFEFSAFFNEEYFKPDPKQPVAFRMHQTESTIGLKKISEKFHLSNDNAATVNLVTGRLDNNGHCVIRIVDNSDPAGRRWIAEVTSPGGGIQECKNEFPVEAPETGYQEKISLNQDSPQPQAFQSGSLYKGGRFYLKSPAGFAVVEFRMVPGNKSIRFISYLNPNGRKLDSQFAGGTSKP